MMETYMLSMVRHREWLQSHINGLMEYAEKYLGDTLGDMLQDAGKVPDQQDNWVDTDNPFMVSELVPPTNSDESGRKWRRVH